MQKKRVLRQDVKELVRDYVKLLVIVIAMETVEVIVKKNVLQVVLIVVQLVQKLAQAV
jgi:hypothetical protein